MNDLLTAKNCEQHKEPPGFENKLLIIKPEKLIQQIRIMELVHAQNPLVSDR